MSDFPEPLDLTKLKVLPLAQRRSLNSLERMLVDPDQTPPPLPADLQPLLRRRSH